MTAVIALAVVAAGCSPGSNLAPLPPAAATEYLLGTGDQLRIITFGEQELTGEFRVGSTGDIAVPLLGSIHAAGLTSAALGRSVERALKAKNLFHDPSVTVEVIGYRPIFILGEVAKPGQYPYQPEMTVLTAVAVAGGFTYRAVDSYASITRTMPDGVGLEGKVARSTAVLPGDVVTIFERRF